MFKKDHQIFKQFSVVNFISLNFKVKIQRGINTFFIELETDKNPTKNIKTSKT